MRANQVEAKLLTLVDRIAEGEAVEDQCTELKRQWLPDHYRAARHIAGLCNAACGQEAMIAFGIDEKLGVVGCLPEEFADWWQRVSSYFVDEVPLLSFHQFVIESKTVCALVLDSQRAPYVVRTQGGGPVQSEVPWRRGNGTRSARRQELLRLLSDRAQMPDIEPLESFLEVSEVSVSGKTLWRLEATAWMYVVPRSPIVFPVHRSTIDVEGLSSEELEWEEGPSPRVYRLTPPYTSSVSASVPLANCNIEASLYEAIVNGPGVLVCRCSFGILRSDPAGCALPSHGRLELHMLPGGVSIPVPVKFLSLE